MLSALRNGFGRVDAVEIGKHARPTAGLVGDPGLVADAIIRWLDEAEVVAALRVCAEHDAPVLARGTGTSLAGQACNVAVVVDTSRHLTRILAIDPEARTTFALFGNRLHPGGRTPDLHPMRRRFHALARRALERAEEPRT